MSKPNSEKVKINRLDSVVKNLTKAALGASAANINFDDKKEVDAFISNMLIEEGKKKEKLYEKIGTMAFSDSLSNNKRTTVPNKRFLLNTIKNTTGYNRYLDKLEKKERSEKTKKDKSKKSFTSSRLFEVSLGGSMLLKRKGHDKKDDNSKKNKIKLASDCDFKETLPERVLKETKINPSRESKEAIIRGRGTTGAKCLDLVFQKDFKPLKDEDIDYENIERSDQKK